MLSVFICLLTLSLRIDARATETSLEQKQCKYTPDSPEWPTASEWANFNETLGGRLLRPSAPAAPCHPSNPLFDAQDCKYITDRWTNSQWHSDNPTSSLWQNWNGYSCLPDAKFECTTDGFPVFVVNATKPEHVKHAVDFARTKNIRLNIKSTGHDFLGRSVQPKSLSIWTHYMRDLEFHEDYSPRGCGLSIPGPAISAGSGAQMRELYRFGADRKVMVVGGSSQTVSIGGYLSFGGHSTLSPAYGMGTDQVIEIELVKANGEIVIANECTNTDLFWAMRGGGEGSTFGVVLKFVIHVIPAVPIASWSGSIVGNSSSDANWDAVAHIHARWAQVLSPLGASGYMIGTPYLLGPKNAPSLSITLPNVANGTLQKVFQPIINEVANITGGRTIVKGSFRYSDSWEKTVGLSNSSTDSRGFPGAGGTKLITSWLWDAESVSSPNLKQVLMNSIDNDTLLFQDFTAGPGTHNPPFMRGEGNAVNPAWRSAFVRPAAEMQWTGLNLEKLAERKSTLQTFHTAMKSLAPNLGSYGNEADAFDLQAEHNFFGIHYARLSLIKEKHDPTGVFYCVNCVNSFKWVDRDGQLCLRSAVGTAVTNVTAPISI
ncbi:FAD-binding domain-containing protein [Tothia fuscella]|uniref:FAD-binding domain-containing protein n=1 Tax=Tothia fuscella TaxID=1048955 RepID=A0A9P4NIC0_9PEZI|nr:FAD-binding domain-containing protein [Tothia fuscella]